MTNERSKRVFCICLLYMLDCVAAASFHIRPTHTDDEDVVVMQ